MQEGVINEGQNIPITLAMIIIDKGVHLWTVQVERRDVQSIEAEVQPLLPHLVEGIHLQRLYGR